MTKTQLSTDLDLVKEIEQLKIKQKLLLRALKDQEKKEEQEKILESMSAQIQFLVEIFKEVNANDSKDIEEENKNQTHEISDKIESIKIAIFERLNQIEEKVDLISESQEVSKNSQNTSSKEKLDILESDPSEQDSGKITKQEIEEVLGESTAENQLIGEEKINSEIPKPDFVMTEEPKKKGWFSK